MFIPKPEIQYHCGLCGNDIVPGYYVCRACGAVYIQRMGGCLQNLVVLAMFGVAFIPMIMAWAAGSFVPLLLIPIAGGFLVWFANSKLAKYTWVKRV
jgi:hypothetical protein